MPPASRPRQPVISAERREQLLALLQKLGLDPLAPGGPLWRGGHPGEVDPDPAHGRTGSIQTVGAHERRSALALSAGHDRGNGSSSDQGPEGAPDPLAPLEQALTHSSTGQPLHHDPLEFLGDAVLRLAATEFLARRHPGLGVGQRSALRAQLVSDRWLAELAGRLDLAALLQLGPMARGDASGRATVQAECCEALVGATYQLWGGPAGGLEAVLRWLTPAWERSCAELLSDPDRHNWKTALQEWTQGQGLGLPRYTVAEMSRRHGDPRRFRARVRWGAAAQTPAAKGSTGSDGVGSTASEPLRSSGAIEGWGGSRRDAEQQAARAALEGLRKATEIRRSPGSSGAG